MARGIIGSGTHIPDDRLQHSALAAALGSGGGRGTHAVLVRRGREVDVDRQILSVEKGKTLGRTHNLGGRPGDRVNFAAIVGSDLG